MSAISEKVRLALYEKMNVMDVTDLASSGIHHMQAPKETPLPYVIFTRVPGTVTYALANNLVGEKDLWAIKAITDEDSSTLSPGELAEQILTACETAIGTDLTLTGNTVHRVRRVNDLPTYTEIVSDRVVYHHGFNLEVFAE